MKENRKQKPVGLLAEHRAIFAKIATGLGVPRVLAAGSRVKGYWTDDSDWDVYLPLQKIDKSWQDKATVLGKKLNMKIDILGGGKIMPSDSYFVEADNGKV